jgi:hypothetical protein
MFVIFSLLQSCAVIKEEFYFPVAAVGTVEKESCRGKVGADNVLVLGLDDISVTFSVKIMGNTQRFTTTLDIPKNVEVVWPKQEIVGITENERFDLTFDHFTKVVSRGDDYKTKDILVETIMVNTTDSLNETYFESVMLPHRDFQELKIESLIVIVNGEAISLPEITFEKREGFFLHPLNC